MRERIEGPSDESLTPEERRAFAELPKERQPSALVRERIVRELRREGRFRDSGGTWRPRRVSHLVAAAAVVVVFAAGFVTGKASGGEDGSGFVTPGVPGAALEVQRTGSVHLAALQRLADETVRATSPEEVEAGREAAVAALHAAARAVATLSPDDPVAFAIRQALFERQPDATTREAEVVRTVAWF